MALIASLLIGGPIWMLVLQFLAWMAGISVTWGMTYAVAVLISFVILRTSPNYNQG